MELYNLTIESLDESGRARTEAYTIEARSETEASNIAHQYSSPFNNVNIDRIYQEHGGEA